MEAGIGWPEKGTVTNELAILTIEWSRRVIRPRPALFGKVIDHPISIVIRAGHARLTIGTEAEPTELLSGPQEVERMNPACGVVQFAFLRVAVVVGRRSR